MFKIESSTVYLVPSKTDLYNAYPQQGVLVYYWSPAVVGVSWQRSCTVSFRTVLRNATYLVLGALVWNTFFGALGIKVFRTFLPLDYDSVQRLNG